MTLSDLLSTETGVHKHRRTSTVVEMWKLNFRTFPVPKHACTTSMMVLLSTETGVHKHRTTSTVVETEFKHVPGSETRLYNLHRTSTTVKTTLSDLVSNETGVHEHCTTSTVVEIVRVNFLGTETGLFDFHESKRLYLIFPALKQVSTSITQPLQLSKLNCSKFLVPKHACTPYTGPPRK